MPTARRFRVLAGLAAALLGGCSFAPAYHVPVAVAPADRFKADPGWVQAVPADAAAKGEWWRLFGDPVLDALEARVAVTNQSVAYYRAAYAQAQATVRESRAALFPSFAGSAGKTRQGTIGGSARTTNTVTGTASWTADLWGSLRNTLAASKADAQASAAQLANATLSAQASLASDYFALRGIDVQIDAIDRTIAGYRRSLMIAQNKYKAGTATASDVETARSTLESAEASRRDFDRQRVAYESAIAALVNENPASFTLAPAPWHPVTPEVPGVIPSVIIERRPDIANAERLMAAANAQIGVARAAFFPTIGLTGQVGLTQGSVSTLFGAANTFWSLGASAADTLFDFGARSAKVAGARAAYDATVATYRQTVLSAFQEVETDLAAHKGYHDEAAHYAAASEAADHAEALAVNEYKAGTVDFTTVSSAQAAAYSARAALIGNIVNRQTAAVALIEAIGGEWGTPAAGSPPQP